MQVPLDAWAEGIICKCEVVTLSERDWERSCKALTRAPVPNAALRHAYARYAEAC